jgi:TetR/AcrR family transcriptional repressor of nem operon
MADQPRTARGRATRERILTATGELVTERGAGNFSLDDVRARAGVSKSQLYLYFADRGALMQALCATRCENTLAAQNELLAGCDTYEGFARYLDAIVAVQEQRHGRGGCPIGSLVAQIAEHDPDARDALADGLDRWEAGLRTGLARMAARRDLREGSDVEALATQTLVIIQGGLLLTQARQDARQMRIAADAALALVIAALD